MTSETVSDAEWGEMLLGQYFKMLSGFAQDQAKDIVDREKTIQSQNVANPQHHQSALDSANSSARATLLGILGQLALAEKTYHSMCFFVAKGFLRKDSSLRSSYEGIVSELLVLKEGAKGSANRGTPAHLLGHISEQVLQYVFARMEMVNFYEHLGSSRPDTQLVPWSQFLEDLRTICDKNHRLFHHPMLAHVKSAFDFETEAMLHMIEAQVHLEDYQFLASLLSLNEAHAKLNSWESLAHACDEFRNSGKIGLSAVISLSGRTPPERALLRWHTAFKASLVSKFSFYFYENLTAQGGYHVDRMKTLFARLSCDYYQKVAAFHRRGDAPWILLAFDAGGMPVHYGYRFPLRYPVSVQGLESFPAILIYPPGMPLAPAHWPSIVMLLSDPVKSAEAKERPVMFYDERMESSYYFMRVEPKITLFVLFQRRKIGRDSAVVTFMNDMVFGLRASKLIVTLCPRSK
ncbi:unnamed protein product [Notodromas monacha]|uniref:Uncharacterized protein n=1 Tax=Notodromas monacha TaxID=399045 RepID=A0A7R9GHL5_9CRUS|nr:unnamed protein product [Notodromas monacha]CAG0921616.1 unnamed protein product [Notodromas monacha]